jgi:phosphate-selective porin OprO and OprP
MEGDMCTSFRILSLLTIIAVPSLALAQSSVEERLNALEARVQELSRENTDLKKQLGWKDEKAPTLVQPAGRPTRLAVGGFLQGQGEFGGAPDSRWSGATANDRFFFRRARVFVSGVLPNDFDFKAELDLQGNTLGGGTGHRVQGNEIFINWRRFPEANVRFGQLKPAFGAEQLASDTRLLTIERYLGNDRLTDGRQLAAAVLGELFEKRLSYLVVFGNGIGSNVSGNDDNHFQRSARVAFTPIAEKGRKFIVGLNGLWSEDTAVARAGLGFTGNTFAGKRDGVGADAALTLGRFDLSAEWLKLDYRPADAAPRAQFDAEAWQVTAGAFLLPGKLQAIVRREWFDPNSYRGGDVVQSWVLGLNYYLRGDDLKFQVNYLRGDRAAGHDDQGRLLTRMQVMF